MDNEDAEEHVPEGPVVECSGCGQKLPPYYFWPIQSRAGSKSSSMQYYGRWEVCRWCASLEPSSQPVEYALKWEDPLPERKTLRDRVKEKQEGVEAEGDFDREA